MSKLWTIEKVKARIGQREQGREPKQKPKCLKDLDLFDMNSLKALAQEWVDYYRKQVDGFNCKEWDGKAEHLPLCILAIIEWIQEFFGIQK